mmetsp:Transcript_116929/g.207001  ORF Transcript_116929/g.207001 Transcript_116929/m.207001 type:complete len:295 (+) Transcript_116929:272-1156(+)
MATLSADAIKRTQSTGRDSILHLPTAILRLGRGAPSTAADASTTRISSPATTSDKCLVRPPFIATYACTVPALMRNGLGGTKPVWAVWACTRHSALAVEPTRIPSPSCMSCMRSRHTRSPKPPTRAVDITFAARTSKAAAAAARSFFRLFLSPFLGEGMLFGIFLASTALSHRICGGRPAPVPPVAARMTNASTPSCEAPARPATCSTLAATTAIRVPASLPAAMRFSAATQTTPSVASSSTHSTEPTAANARSCVSEASPLYATPITCPSESRRQLPSASQLTSALLTRAFGT